MHLRTHQEEYWNSSWHRDLHVWSREHNLLLQQHMIELKVCKTGTLLEMPV